MVYYHKGKGRQVSMRKNSFHHSVPAMDRRREDSEQISYYTELKGIGRRSSKDKQIDQ